MAVATDTPATGVPESAGGMAGLFAEAQAELTAAEAPAPTAPESSTQQQAAEPEVEEEATSPDTEAGQSPKSRRERGEEAYQRGVQAGIEQAKREAEEAQKRDQEVQSKQEEESSLLTLIQQTREGDYQSSKALADKVEGMLNGTKQQQQQAALYMEGRNSVLGEIVKDFEAIKELPDIKGNDAVVENLAKAPSVFEFGKRAYEAGKASANERIASLEAKVTELTGKLAGRTPSPETASGTSSGGGSNEAQGMAGYWAAAKAELGAG